MDKNNEFENNTPDVEGEAVYDNKNDKDIKEGSEENREVLEEKTQDNEKKEEADEEKTSGADKEKSGTEEVGREDDVNSRRSSFSANYEPPYYVPNFTVYGENNDDGMGEPQRPKKEKKTVGIGVLAAICAICVLVSATVGAIAGAIASGGNVLEIGVGGEKETISIIRSDREINVEEITGSTGYTDLSVAQVAALVGDSVVEITTTHVETSSIYGQYITSGAGSGVIFCQKNGYGYIVTNYHVIDGANDIKVRVKDGDTHTDYSAEYIAGDAAEDIAVVRIPVGEAVELTVAIFVSDSDDLVVGEQVVAIGNPLGQLGGTVTDGIISALDREITIEDNVMTLLQTNAAINPGNSGGGLFNMSGELIGIVNAKQSSAGIEGLGFAIPANIVAKDIEDIINDGYIRGRATLGIEVQYGTTHSGSTGVFVTNSGSTDFSYMDRIVQIGDTVIEDMADYNAALKALEIDQTVTVKVYRNNGAVIINAEVMENKSKY